MTAEFQNGWGQLKVNRCGRVPLCAQMAKAIKRFIVAEKLQAGDVLPSFRAMADRTHVSEKVVRMALARLADDGWIRPRWGVGFVVCEGAYERKRVLFLNGQFGFSRFAAQFVHEIKISLEGMGYVLIEESVLDGRCHERLSTMRRILDERWDLVLELCPRVETARLLDQSENQFVIIGESVRSDHRQSSNCIGQINLSERSAVADIMRVCARINAKTVWQVMFGGGPFDVTGPLASFGCKVTTLSVAPCADDERIAGSAYRLMVGLLSRARMRLPDLLLVSDDVVARGVLFALQEKGVRAPEALRLIVHSNRGTGLLWPRPLTRFETDPVEYGVKTARAVRSFLRKGVFSDFDLTPAWVAGETC